MEQLVFEHNVSSFDYDDKGGDKFRDICRLSSDSEIPMFADVTDVIHKNVRSAKFLTMCSLLRTKEDRKEELEKILSKNEYSESDYLKVLRIYLSVIKQL